MKMSQSALRKLCREHELYSTPSLNETLYCNFQGFTSIAALEPYTALKSLFLEGNALVSLEGLPCLLELKCLYVQNNSLSSLECLGSLANLEVLNVSSNELTSLDGIAPCEKLQTLICSGNQLDSLKSLEELSSCSALSTLDLQTNKLRDTQVLEHLQRFPEMRSLYLRDNPFLEAVRNSRKTIIASMPLLAYLDDRPVFELERRCAEAWVRGGPQAESAAREQMQVEAAAKDRANFDTLQAMRRESFRKRRKALGLPPGDTDPFFDTLKDKDFDEEAQEDEDPPELLEAQAKLAALSVALPGEPEPAENPPPLGARAEIGKGEGNQAASPETGDACLPACHADGTAVTAGPPAASGRKETGVGGYSNGNATPGASADKFALPAANALLDEPASAGRAGVAPGKTDLNGAENRTERKAECETVFVGANVGGPLPEQEALAISSLDLDDSVGEIVPTGTPWEDELDEETEGPAGEIQPEVIGRGLDNLIQGLRAVDASNS